MDTDRVVLSNSKIDCAEGCSYRYHLRYNLKVPAPSRPPLIRGTAVHATVRHAMRQKQDAWTLPTLEEIFSQLAVEQDTAAISREIADLIQA